MIGIILLVTLALFALAFGLYQFVHKKAEKIRE